jgi:cytochrome c
MRNRTVAAFAAWLLSTAAAAGAGAPADDAALADAGKRQFVRCAACHSLSAAAPPMFGPHLEGIVGRTAGMVEDYEYSDPKLRAQSFVWDEPYFDEWLEDPRAEYPEMCLAFSGLTDPETRQALIAYLREPAP